MSHAQPTLMPDGSRKLTSRGAQRSTRRRACRGLPPKAFLCYRGKHSKRLSVHPDVIEDGAGSISRHRFQLVRNAIERSGIGPYLERRLREHPGKPCAYRPTMVLAALILAAMRNDQLEVTDALKALNSLSIRDRVAEGLFDDGGYFVGYRSFDHQFNRLSAALEEGWTDNDGTFIDAEVVVAALIAASIPEDFTATAITLDGTDVRTWAKIRWFEAMIQDQEALDQIAADTVAYEENDVDIDDAEAAARDAAIEALKSMAGTKKDGTKKRSAKKATASKRRYDFPVSEVDGRPIPTRCPDARLAKRTPTPADKVEFYAGFEMHTASAVRDFSWNGDPAKGQLGPKVPPFITGVKLCRGNQQRAAAAVHLIDNAHQRLPAMREVIVDRGYSSAVNGNLHERVVDLGLELVRDYTKHERARISTVKVPVGRRSSASGWKPARTQTLIRSAGSLFHEFTPTEYLAAPILPPKGGAGDRPAAEAFYNERAAYIWREHSCTPSGDIRFACPVHAGRLRPLDLNVAINRGLLELPALDPPPGHTTCCTAQTISTDLAMRSKLFQHVPYGTSAWSLSYGRRSSAETRHSDMRTGLARLQRGYFKVFGLTKATLMMGMMCVSINLQLQEQQSRDTDIETVELDTEELTTDVPSETDDDDENPAVAQPRVDEPPGDPPEVDLTNLDALDDR